MRLEVNVVLEKSTTKIKKKCF